MAVSVPVIADAIKPPDGSHPVGAFVVSAGTSGGVAPTGSCTAGQTVQVPYKAIYVFWDAPAA